MLEISRLWYRYPGESTPALQDINLVIEPGMFLAVVGPSGSGKSTLLRSLNGLVPHFHGGAFGGKVCVEGADTRRLTTADLSRTIGFVSQEPEGQTVFDTVADEIAFGPENLSLPRDELIERVETAMDTLGIANLCDRDISTLSGGERQRVVIAATLAMGSSVVVMDEPLSQLDPWAAGDLVGVLHKLNRDQEITVVVAEHRIDRLLPYCSHVLQLDPLGRGSTPAPVGDVLDRLAHKPALSHLGRAFDLPHVRDSTFGAAASNIQHRSAILPQQERKSGQPQHVMLVQGACVDRSRSKLIDDVSLDVSAGSVTALMGRNGSGKTTLLRAMAGLQQLTQGKVLFEGTDVNQLSMSDRANRIGYVPQQPSALFLGQTVREEVEITLEQTGSKRDPKEILRRFELDHLAERYSYDISGGERQRLALAIVVARRPEILLLDEPTRGMDLSARQRLELLINELVASGSAVVMATHDSELSARCADRVVLLEAGRTLMTGPPAEILNSDPALMTDATRIPGSGLACIDDNVAARNQEQSASD